MELLRNNRYLETLRALHTSFPHWSRLEEKSMLISGATGLLGSLLIDAIMLWNQGLPAEKRCRITALGRNQAAAEKRFSRWLPYKEFLFVSHDITKPLPEGTGAADFLIHAASPADPVAFVAEPINTVCANLIGTQSMLEYSQYKQDCRLLLCSSGEVYGENRGDTERFQEDYCGYLNCNTLRAGYPEGKRVSESLCQAYIEEKGTDAVIIRLPRCYGPTMRMTDSKALAQFIKKAIAGEDIVLKSEGKQLYSFLYAADAVSAMLWVLLQGKTGEAYNAADERSDITLWELANVIAAKAGTSVCYELPEESERKGYSTATKALLDGNKLKKLGWKAQHELTMGIEETIRILRETTF